MGHIANSDFLGNKKCRHNRLHVIAHSDYNERMLLRIKDVRKQRGLTQRQVAELAGMSVSYFTEIEGGKKQINASRLESIAKALRVEPADLILKAGNSSHDELMSLVTLMDDEQKRLLVDLARKLTQSDAPQ